MLSKKINEQALQFSRLVQDLQIIKLENYSLKEITSTYKKLNFFFMILILMLCFVIYIKKLDMQDLERAWSDAIE